MRRLASDEQIQGVRERTQAVAKVVSGCETNFISMDLLGGEMGFERPGDWGAGGSR